MKKVFKKSAIALFILSLVGCSGSDSDTSLNGGGANQPPTSDDTITSKFSLGVSDAPVDDAEAVYIEIDRITLTKVEATSDDEELEGEEELADGEQLTDGEEATGKTEVIIENFTDEDGNELDTIKVNLLDFQGSAQLKIVDEAQNIEVENGNYQMELLVIDAGSYVLLDSDATEHKIKVPSSRLRLGEFTVNSEAVQVNDKPAYTVEFDLRQSLVLRGNANNNNGFILKPHGVRIVSQAGDIAGSVSADFTNLGECTVYLYDSAATEFGDMFDSSDTAFVAPTEEITASAPLATTTVAADGTYEIGYVEAGSYQVALTCGVAVDDNIQLDGVTIPSAGTITPDVQVVEVNLGQVTTANF